MDPWEFSSTNSGAISSTFFQNYIRVPFIKKPLNYSKEKVKFSFPSWIFRLCKCRNSFSILMTGTPCMNIYLKFTNRNEYRGLGLEERFLSQLQTLRSESKPPPTSSRLSSVSSKNAQDFSGSARDTSRPQTI